MLSAVIQQGLRQTFENVIVPVAVAALAAYAMIRSSEIGAIAAMNAGGPEEEEEPTPPKPRKKKAPRRSR